MKALLLDTNVVFDIIYIQRPRFAEAHNFYTGFNNFALSIEPRVHKECNTVLLEYAVSFATELENYIVAKQKHMKAWNLLKPSQRKSLLNGFVSFAVQRNGDDQDGKIPFYRQIIDKVGVELTRMTYSELREFLLEISPRMMGHLRAEMRARFVYLIPMVDIANIATYKFIDDLKNKLAGTYFKQKQSEDRAILVSVIHLITFGDTDGNSFESITFYTYDDPFLESYQAVCSNPPKLTLIDYDNYLTEGLRALTMRKPY